MNRELIRSLIKDYSLPIAFYEEPYFSYFAKLLDPYYLIFDKINLLQKETQDLPMRDFASQYHKISEAIITAIKATPAFNQFIQENFNLPLPPEGFAQTQKLYTTAHEECEIYSIDLIKANFNVLRAFNPAIVLNANTYEELFSKFSGSLYLQGSKKIRQVIFGNLNPKRQQTLQRYYLSWIKHYLLSQGLQEEQILLSSSDELVFQANQIPEGQLTQMIQFAFTKPQTLPMAQSYRLQKFTIKRLSPNLDFFVKEYANPAGLIEFKNIPQSYLAQCIKKYQNQPITEMDRKFVTDGLVATFDQDIFTQKEGTHETDRPNRLDE